MTAMPQTKARVILRHESIPKSQDELNFELVLAAALRHTGVECFYIRNTKDFREIRG